MFWQLEDTNFVRVILWAYSLFNWNNLIENLRQKNVTFSAHVSHYGLVAHGKC